MVLKSAIELHLLELIKCWDETFPNTVSDLIDWSNWSWKYDLISQVFWQVDVHHILQVPFGAPEVEDRIVWAYSKSGNFTVRSCYHNLISGKLRVKVASTSIPGTILAHWDWIWGLRVPPKVRTFLWRACHEILPTRVPLMRRHVGSNPSCEFCSREAETEAHIFFSCPLFSSIWSDFPFNISLAGSTQSFSTGLGHLKRGLVWLVSCAGMYGTFVMIGCTTSRGVNERRWCRVAKTSWIPIDQPVSVFR